MAFAFIFSMSQEAVERFIGRLITDEVFRECAKTDFQKACFKFGFSLTTDEQQLVMNLDFEKIMRMEEGIEDGIKRWGILDEAINKSKKYKHETLLP